MNKQQVLENLEKFEASVEKIELAADVLMGLATSSRDYAQSMRSILSCENSDPEAS